MTAHDSGQLWFRHLRTDWELQRLLCTPLVNCPSGTARLSLSVAAAAPTHALLPAFGHTTIYYATTPTAHSMKPKISNRLQAIASNKHAEQSIADCVIVAL